jgi:hypothetical protein
MTFGHRAILVAIITPPMLALGLVFAIAAAEVTGHTLFADVVPSNLAEAAAAGRADDVVRRIQGGEAVQLVYPVRPDATHSPLTRATPAEAAVWSRQLLMVHVLDRAGAIPAADRDDLACLALDLELHDIAAYLAPAGANACVPQRARERVLTRAGG